MGLCSNNDLSHAYLWGPQHYRRHLSTLALSARWKLFRLGDDSPTTRGKVAFLAKGLPIDHLVCNAQFLDLFSRTWVNSTLWLSDHLPLVCQFACDTAPPLAWRWPKTMCIPKEKVAEIAWSCQGNTYVEWLHAMRRWISNSYGVAYPDPTCVSVEPFQMKKVEVCKVYQTLCASQRCLRYLLASPSPSASQLASLARKFKALDIPFSEDLEQCSHDLDQKMAAYLELTQKNALARWKEKVKAWHSQSAELYKYLKNPSPSKCVVLHDENGTPATEAGKMHALLKQYWSSIEEWPNPLDCVRAQEWVWDHYCAFIPHVPHSFCLTQEKLHAQAQRMSNSAPGVDGVTMNVLKCLPPQAWGSLLHTLSPTLDLTCQSPCLRPTRGFRWRKETRTNLVLVTSDRWTCFRLLLDCLQVHRWRR